MLLTEPAAAGTATYIYILSQDKGVRSLVLVYAAFGVSFTSLVPVVVYASLEISPELDRYATLSVVIIALRLFLRHTIMVVMMTVAIIKISTTPATPTPTESEIIVWWLAAKEARKS